LEGDELRVPGRVNLVKENTLSEISSPGLVGIARVTTRVSRVKAFSLFESCQVSRVEVAGLSGLAGLRSDKAKTSPQTDFSLILKLGPD
jgi:hypothetical protein